MALDALFRSNETLVLQPVVIFVQILPCHRGLGVLLLLVLPRLASFFQEVAEVHGLLLVEASLEDLGAQSRILPRSPGSLKWIFVAFHVSSGVCDLIIVQIRPFIARKNEIRLVIVLKKLREPRLTPGRKRMKDSLVLDPPDIRQGLRYFDTGHRLVLHI